MTGIILLAAGSSSRLGQPKQQLIYQNKTLLQHAIEVAIASEAYPIILITGASAELIYPAIKDYNVTIIQNAAWQKGMGSSLKCGIEQLLKIEPLIEGAIIMVCDQPYVDASLLNKLIHEKHKSNKPIVASAYNNTLGVPALFDRSFFGRLLELQGQEGAKRIILAFSHLVSTVPFPLGNVDIDTLDDYNNLLG